MVGAMYVGAALAAWLPVRHSAGQMCEPSDIAAD
jgi:hypothetical protein